MDVLICFDDGTKTIIHEAETFGYDVNCNVYEVIKNGHSIFVTKSMVKYKTN